MADPAMLDQWYSDYLAKPTTTTEAVASPPAAVTEWTPDAQATVQGQLKGMLDAGSPLMDLAATRAKQTAAARGLQNSSIAAGAGHKAMIDSALPIAQQDAATFAQAGQFNAGAKNQNAQFNTGMLADFSRFNAQASNDAKAAQTAAGATSGQMQQQASINRAQQQQQFENQRQLLTAQTDEQLRMLDAQNGTKLSDSYRAASQSTYDAYIADVQRIQESDMDPDVKAAQVANLQGLYETRQEFINTIYRYSPGWSSEWSQFAVEFGG